MEVAMNLENQAKKHGVCDLEYAKKLEELGVKQESLWFWNQLNYKGNEKFYISGRKDYTSISAFTVSELDNVIKEFDKEESGLYDYLYDKRCMSDIEILTMTANEKAELLIYLLKNKLI